MAHQLERLAETLREQRMDAARIEVLRSQAERNRRTTELLDLKELEALLSLAGLLEGADETQRAALETMIQEKLDQFIPASLRQYPENSVLVVATPGFEWAAHQVAGVLASRSTPVEISLAETYEIARQNPDVVGVVEVEVNVYQAFENVKVICVDSQGKEIWTKKRVFNAGGSPEQLARDMVGAVLQKVKRKTCP